MASDAFVPYTVRTGYLLNGIPPAHQRRLHKRAVKQNTSVANVIGQILADRYGIDFQPSGRPLIAPTVAAASGRFSLRLPQEVVDAVRAEADVRAVTMRSVMIDALSEALKLKSPPPTAVDPVKRPGRPRTERNH